MREKVLMSWSGGKDSALALFELIGSAQDHEVVGLLTTVTRDYDRISMHGVRRSLLRMQCERIGLPLDEIALGAGAGNEEYAALMEEAMLRWKGRGVRTVAFGDIHLEDVRSYREGNLARVGMTAIFPLWGREPRAIAREFVGASFRAVVVCLDKRYLDSSFAGRVLDEALFDELPASVDRCGENGEFHTFVFDGPIFREPVGIRIGEVVERDGFVFCDVMPSDE